MYITEKNESSGSWSSKAPMRPDIISFTHHNITKNNRQPYCVNVDTGKHIYYDRFKKNYFQFRKSLKRSKGHFAVDLGICILNKCFPEQ